MRTLPIVVALLCTCGPLPSPDAGEADAEEVDAGTTDAGLLGVINTLPVCSPGQPTQQVTIARHFCTLKACQSACCNMCSWTGPAGVQALGLPESALDCELDAWNATLAAFTFNLTASPPCRAP